MPCQLLHEVGHKTNCSSGHHSSVLLLPSPGVLHHACMHEWLFARTHPPNRRTPRSTHKRVRTGPSTKHPCKLTQNEDKAAGCHASGSAMRRCGIRWSNHQQVDNLGYRLCDLGFTGGIREISYPFYKWQNYRQTGSWKLGGFFIHQDATAAINKAMLPSKESRGAGPWSTPRTWTMCTRTSSRYHSKSPDTVLWSCGLLFRAWPLVLPVRWPSQSLYAMIPKPTLHVQTLHIVKNGEPWAKSKNRITWPLFYAWKRLPLN